jgi:hypothetical protein
MYDLEEVRYFLLIWLTTKGIVRDPKTATGLEENYEVTVEEQRHFDDMFEKLLDVWQTSEGFRAAARKLCTHQSISTDDAEQIRQHFHAVGVSKLGLDFALYS